MEIFGVEIGTNEDEQDSAWRVRLIDGGTFNLKNNSNVFLGLLKAADAKFKALEEKITALEKENAELRAKTDGVMNYRGIHEDNLIYRPDDCVTKAGALWIAKYETASKPPGPAWLLCVKSDRKGSNHD